MRQHRLLAIGLSAFLGCAASFSVAAAQAKTPTQTYLDYQATVTKATTLTEPLPYLSAAYRRMLESRPKADQPVWLGRLKEAVMKDVKVTKETIAGTNGNACTLEATGTSASGNAMKGKISLVKEGGAWKLDEQGWSTGKGA